VTDEIHYLGLLEVSERIRRRELTAEAVTRAALQRIERHERRLHSILLLMADTALEEARRADREIAAGLWRGPLHGVPIGIKDLLWTKGLPTTGGMEIFKDFRPEADATVVERLRRAGAVLIGKLHTTEGAHMSHHPSFPRPANPWSEAHWTGVSSSGSGVATAAGFCYGALGTDTGGSIRAPSSANNLTGIKPTWGRVSRYGLFPLSESMDHIGPMARSAVDAAAILQVIAGADPKDPTALSEPLPDFLAGRDGGVDDLSIGVDWDFATNDTPEPVAAALRAAAETFAALGARIRPIDFPSGDDVVQATPLLSAEVAAAHAEHFPQKADRYGPRLRRQLETAAKMDAMTVAKACQARDRFAGRLRQVFHDVDLILLPGLSSVVPTWDEVEAFGDEVGKLTHVVMRFTIPFNIAGVPTISLPAGFTEDGLPIGVQLIGWRMAEPTLIRAGAAFQRVTDFHTRHPRLDG
jgi:amidase